MKRYALLTLLLVVPLVVIVFLYVFGKNQYDAQNPAYKGKFVVVPKFRFEAPTVLFISIEPEKDCLLIDRLLFRLRNLPQHGPFRFYQLHDGQQIPCQQLSQQHTTYSTIQLDSREQGRIRSQLGYVATQPKIAILTRADGSVVNLYNLEEETMQDSLVTEALIVVEQK